MGRFSKLLFLALATMYLSRAVYSRRRRMYENVLPASLSNVLIAARPAF
jgi:hypothetical protein